MKNSKIFRPIVASSLALALSANVAVAEESISETIQSLSRGGGLVRAGEASFTSNQPIDGTSTAQQPLQFSNNETLSFENGNLFLNNGSKTQINHLKFTFTKDKAGEKGQNTVSTTDGVTTAILFSDTKPNQKQAGKTLVLNGGASGAKIGQLDVDFGMEGQNSSGYNVFKMDFQDTALVGKTAFTGNVTIKGAGYGTTAIAGQSRFDGTFVGDFLGNITLDNKTGLKASKSQLYNQLTFTGNASLKGNLILQDGELHLSLDNGTVNSIEIQEDPKGGTKNPKLFLYITGNGSIGSINDQTQDPDITKKPDLDLQNNSKLSLQGDATFATLKFQGTNTIDLSKQTTGAPKAGSAHRTLTINSLDTNTGTSLTFISRVSKDGADKVIIDGKTGTGTQTYSMQVVADDTAKENKAIIATVKKEGDNGIIDLGNKAEVTQGQIKGSFNLKKTDTDKDGGTTNANYFSYELNGFSGEETTPPTEPEKPVTPPVEPEKPVTPPTEPEKPVTPPVEPEKPITPPTEQEKPVTPADLAQYEGQQEAEYAISTSTDLFLANFNSLNKRMGDLRDNANSQGVWARVFHGSQTNAFTATKSKSKYATIQGGYDYGFALNNGAKTYLGLAFSYGHSSLSQSNTEIGKSDLIELALYNSYIENTGWYNDTIAKFSYLMNGINSSNVEFNNFAFLFSNEFGYRFKLGANKEWFIDPQLELGVAYINGGEFKDQNVTTDVASMMILKNRLGSSFGYEFKNEKSTLKLYAGGFYEFDYFNSDISKWSGNILGYSVGGEIKSDLNGKLDHRFVLNLGTNAEIGENTRIYFDFETSFAGKITTDYKFNFGARYAFGQKTINTPKEVDKAPIKLESNEQPKENKEIKEDKGNKEIKVNKGSEENKVNKGGEENKINKGNKGNKANKGSKGNKGSKANKGSKGNKVSKGNKTK